MITIETLKHRRWIEKEIEFVNGDRKHIYEILENCSHIYKLYHDEYEELLTYAEGYSAGWRQRMESQCLN
jgi:hypothetical protein